MNVSQVRTFPPTFALPKPSPKSLRESAFDKQLLRTDLPETPTAERPGPELKPLGFPETVTPEGPGPETKPLGFPETVTAEGPGPEIKPLGFPETVIAQPGPEVKPLGFPVTVFREPGAAIPTSDGPYPVFQPAIDSPRSEQLKLDGPRPPATHGDPTADPVASEPPVRLIEVPETPPNNGQGGGRPLAPRAFVREQVNIAKVGRVAAEAEIRPLDYRSDSVGFLDTHRAIVAEMLDSISRWPRLSLADVGTATSEQQR